MEQRPKRIINKKNFKFYVHTFALSFEEPTAPNGSPTKCDFFVDGNPAFITNVLIELMESQPNVAKLIMNTAYNYAKRRKDEQS